MKLRADRPGNARRRAAAQPRIILFNKPYGVLSQFGDADGRPGLHAYIPVAGVYAAGRLDADSEGLLLLTDDGALQHRLTDPRHKLAKTYWVQVEGVVDAPALRALETGVDIGDARPTLPCRASAMAAPAVWPRDPPIRERRAIPTSWLCVELREGRNRQLRRMTARVGFPTLRLIRYAIGPWSLQGLAPGQWREAQARPERPADGARVQPVRTEVARCDES